MSGDLQIALPPPGPDASYLEKLFRRLLLKCHERVAASLEGRQPEPQNAASAGWSEELSWQHDPKFHFHVDTLQEQLADLEHMRGSQAVQPEILALYKRAVGALSSSLEPTPNTPAFCRKQHQFAHRKTPSGASESVTPRTHGTPKHSRGPSMSTPPLLSPTKPSAGTRAVADTLEGESLPAAQGLSEAGGLQHESESLEARLGVQGDLQESLTDEMVDLASKLKANTRALEAQLRKRGSALEDAGELLAGNVDGAKEAASRTQKRREATRRGLCGNLLLLGAVIAVAVAMLAFIQGSSLAARVVPWRTVASAAKERLAATAAAARARARGEEL